MMSRKIDRSDTVGLAVAKIYRTPWHVYEDCEICDAFVALANGTVFKLENCCDDDWDGPKKLAKCLDAWEVSEIDFECAGAVVQDVATSDYWPTIGVVLSNGLILHMDAPHCYKFCPVVSVLGDSHPTDGFRRCSYGSDDFNSVWT